jgi:beta-glucuronidase
MRSIIPKHLLIIVLSIAPIQTAFGSQATINPEQRESLNLDGRWNAIVDPYDTGYYDRRGQPYDAVETPVSPTARTGFYADRTPATKNDLLEYGFDRSPMLTVPRDWNTQDPRLLLYEGAIWYRRLFSFAAKEGNRVFLHVGAANYESEMYLNAHKMGEHIGGFTPYDIEVTGRIKIGDNSLVIRVNNRRLREGVPTLDTDWWNFGGLTRDVYLYETPKAYLSNYNVQLSREDPSRIEVSAEVAGGAAGDPVSFEIPELNVRASARADSSGHVSLEVSAPASLVKWCPENPKLYRVCLGAGPDQVSEQIGFRTIQVKGSDILLNGKPVFLRGVCIHEENPVRGGRAYSREDARLLLGWARELNCNFVRLAHYPHSEHMAQVADELGIMVWEEIPVYWSIAWENPQTLENARNQLDELITRDHNRASVIVWSVANETPVIPARTEFLRRLVDEARARDGTRLVSAAMELRAARENRHLKVVDDPFGAYTDILSFNEYVGWYDSNNDDIPMTQWSLKYAKPVVISETGAEGLQGFHADAETRFAEEYQAEFFRRTIPMLRKIDQLRGICPWILADFRSPKRLLPNVQDGWNRKGLVGDNGVKKEAFHVVASLYQEIKNEANR